MNYIIEKDINPIYELFKTFYYLANEDEEIESFNKTLDKESLDKDKYKKNNLKNFHKFIDKFKKQNKIPMDKIQFYFKDIKDSDSKTNNFLANIFLVNLDLEDLQSVKKRILSLPTSELESNLIRDIISFLEDIFDSNSLKSINSKESLLKFLISNSKNLSPEIKWNLTVLLEDSKKHLLELISIITDSLEIFKNTFSILDKDKEIFIKELNTTFKENPDYLTSLFGFKLDNDSILNIYPSMINFKSIDITYNEGKISAIPGRYNCYFGYKFKELIALTNGKKNESELLQDKLKALGDKSKYEILKMLNNGPMYGQQIAEKLSLTTATISYHMNSLVLCGLVKLNKVDNKIYYNSNKDEINYFLKKLGEELT